MRALTPNTYLANFMAADTLLSPTGTYTVTLLNNTSAVTDTIAMTNWNNLSDTTAFIVPSSAAEVKSLVNPRLEADTSETGYTVFTANSVVWGPAATFTTDAAIISDINGVIISIYRYDTQVLVSDTLTLNFNDTNGIIRINNNALSLNSHSHAQEDIVELISDLATITSAINTKENYITPGTSTQYYRGDKTWSSDLSTFGLDHVDNTHDIDKPISSATSAMFQNYETSASHNASLLNYNTSAEVSDILLNYETSAAHNISISNYATSASLNDYVTSTSLNSTLNNYETSANHNSSLLNYATSASLNNYSTSAHTHINATSANAGFLSSADFIKFETAYETGTVTSANNGLMIAADKIKLDTIETSANNYIHPTNHDQSIITSSSGWITNCLSSKSSSAHSHATSAILAPGTSAQFLRGDLNWEDLPAIDWDESNPTSLNFINNKPDLTIYPELNSHTTLIDISYMPASTLSTGLISGGSITSGSPLSSATSGITNCINISAGSGYIVNNYSDPANPTATLITWDDFIDEVPPDLETASNSYIAININGHLIWQEEPFSAEDMRDLIVFGWIDHYDNETIDLVFDEPYWTGDTHLQLLDFLLSFGAFNISDNDVYSATSSAYPMRMRRTAGKSFFCADGKDNAGVFNRKSPNTVVSNALDPCMFQYYWRNGSDSWFNEGSLQDDVDPDHWDNATSALSEVTSGSWTIQAIMMYPPLANSLDVQYGQKEYATLEDAKNGINNAIQIDPYNGGDIFRAWLCIKQGCTNLADPLQAVFLPAGKLGIISNGSSGGVGGEANTGSNIGTRGVGAFDRKFGTDLQFRNFDGGDTNTIDVTYNDAEETILFDLNTIPSAHGGTGTSAWNSYDIPYIADNVDNTFTAISPNTSANRSYLTMTGNGTSGAPPEWYELTASSLNLGNVDNTSDADKPISSATSAMFQNYVTSATIDVDNFVTSADLENYETSAAHALSLNNYATSASLSNYATSASLSNYETSANHNSSLQNYATSASLSNYVTSASLGSYDNSQILYGSPTSGITHTSAFSFNGFDAVTIKDLNVATTSGVFSVASSANTSAHFIDVDGTSISKTTPGVSQEIIDSAGYTYKTWLASAGEFRDAIKISSAPDSNPSFAAVGKIEFNSWTGPLTLRGNTNADDPYSGLTLDAALSASVFREGGEALQNKYRTSISLSAVNNTSDVNKPVSSATSAALNLKLDSAKITYGTTAPGSAAELPDGTLYFKYTA
jgi:hypothetical protein